MMELVEQGVGRSIKHKSFAGSALESRVDLINQTIDKKISLFVIDKEDQGGTTVTIRLPINSAQYD